MMVQMIAMAGNREVETVTHGVNRSESAYAGTKKILSIRSCTIDRAGRPPENGEMICWRLGDVDE
jgi:hypothetical protein